MKISIMQSSSEVYSLTGTYLSVRALRRAKATPIPADAKNMTQNLHTVYRTASPEPMAAIVGEAISITVLKDILCYLVYHTLKVIQYCAYWVTLT